MNSLQSPSEHLEVEVIRRLKAEGLLVVADPDARLSNAKVRQDTEQQPPTPSDAQSSAIGAARRRIEKDKRVRRPRKVLLTAEEEVGLALLVRGKSGTALPIGAFGQLTGEARLAAECLLLHNEGLAHSVAQKYSLAGMTHDDLVQHGIRGLIRAVELFDPALGNKFSTYAMNWVRQAITRAIADESRLIRIPVHMVEKISKVWRKRIELTVNGTPPTVQILAAACGLKQEEILDCLILGPQEDMRSLDQPLGDSEMTLGDLLTNEPSTSTPWEDRLTLESLRKDINEILQNFPDRNAQIIRLRFGFDDNQPRTLDEIGTIFGVTRERIRQIEAKIITQLRDNKLAAILRPYW
ncbi:sigma-70 family RNA polymerase sigma factor [[Mycobacterium] nativiensis]|uniref:Sigma-70 family RNA polymerase sigma factor n=1 Tax=[Mycobacterium] nativiensis TaxID=2855503 RepID=A0ABU5XWC9_9MYCO|nr:sigma-70 family RNA polymerase sigma factor [Mycolicibacter sp. MYC340]MEB3032092.1 sigma-70 family RNA polymerase sigma factor [Mycolicibacter sp. MYC340]